MTLPRRSFTQLDNEVLDRMPEIGVGPAAVLLQLLRHRNRRTGQCNPSYATLARKTGLNRDSVIRHIRKLEALGWIIKRASWAQEGDQSSNWYAFADWITGDRTESPGNRTIRPPLPENTVSYDQGGRAVRPEPEENNSHIRIKDVSLPKGEEPEARDDIPADDAMTASQQACAHHAGTLRFGEVILCDLCFAALTPPSSHCRNTPLPQAQIRPSGEMH